MQNSKYKKRIFVTAWNELLASKKVRMLLKACIITVIVVTLVLSIVACTLSNIERKVDDVIEYQVEN